MGISDILGQSINKFLLLFDRLVTLTRSLNYTTYVKVNFSLTINLRLILKWILCTGEFINGRNSVEFIMFIKSFWFLFSLQERGVCPLSALGVWPLRLEAGWWKRSVFLWQIKNQLAKSWLYEWLLMKILDLSVKL